MQKKKREKEENRRTAIINAERKRSQIGSAWGKGEMTVNELFFFFVYRANVTSGRKAYYAHRVVDTGRDDRGNCARKIAHA